MVGYVRSPIIYVPESKDPRTWMIRLPMWTELISCCFVRSAPLGSGSTCIGWGFSLKKGLLAPRRCAEPRELQEPRIYDTSRQSDDCRDVLYIRGSCSSLRSAHLRGASSPFLRDNPHPIQVLPYPSGTLLAKQREISSVHVGSLIIHVRGSLDLGT